MILLPLTQIVSRHFNVVLKEDYTSLRYLLCVDKRLESRLDCIRRIVIAPEFCLETVAGFYSETVFEVEQNHALSNFTSSVLYPLLMESLKLDQDGAHLASSNRNDWDAVTMNTFDLNICESTLVIWSEQSFLILPKFSSMNYTRQNMIFILFKCSGNMKFSAICFIFNI